MAAKSELKGKISLENQDFLNKLRQSAAAGVNFSNEIAKGMLKASGAIWVLNKAVGEVQGTWDQLRNKFEAASEIEQVARRTGMTAGALWNLRKAARASGVEFSSMETIINKMQKALSGVNEMGRNTTDAFLDLNLSMDDLRAMAPEKQFQAIGAAISALKNPADRASAAMDIFGKSGGEVLKIFENPNIQLDLNKPLTGVARIMQEYGNAMDQVNIQLRKLGVVKQSFFYGLAGPLSTVILPFLTLINSHDLSDIGKRFGTGIADGIRALYNAFQEGNLPELMKLSVKVAFEQGANTLYNWLPRFGKAFSDLFGSDIWSKLSNIFDGIALQFGAALMDAMANPIATLQTAIQFMAEKGGAVFSEHDFNKRADMAEKSAVDITQEQIALLKAHANIPDGGKDARGEPTYKKGRAGWDSDENFNKYMALEKRWNAAMSDADTERASAEHFRKIRTQSPEDYLADPANMVKPTFFGQSSEAMRNKGTTMVNENTKGIGALAESLGKNIGKDLSWRIPMANQTTPFGDSSGQLKARIAALQKPIPGQGTTANPDAGIPTPGTDDLFNVGKKMFRLERIHRGLDGMTNRRGNKFGIGDLTGDSTGFKNGVLGSSGLESIADRRHFSMDSLMHPTLASLHDSTKQKPQSEAQKHTSLLEGIKKSTDETAKNIMLVLAG